MGRLVLVSAVLLWSAATRPARADDPPLVRNNYGSVGMIDMPSARMAPDGDLSVSAAYFQNTQRYDLGFQALPWLETDVRYSGLERFILQPEYPVYWDRSFAMKARLWQESDLLPAVAVGIDDLVGTGIYSGEYLVGSKRFGAVDFSLGIGWGRLGSTDQFKNPIADIFPSFGNPRPTITGAGGTNFGVFFHGPYSGLFGGAIWQTPIDGLSLAVEYSSDAYSLETQTGNFTPRNQMNYGASYRVTNSIAVSLDWLYGRSIGGNISFELNPVVDFPQRVGPSVPPAPPPRSSNQQQEALDLMLGRHPGSLASPEKFGSNAKLVDALWLENSDLVDVTVKGRQLSLAIAGGDTAQACQSVARTAGLYSVTITAVEVSNGNRRQTCPVTMTPALALLSSDTGSRPGTALSSSAIASTALITIDAAIEPTPDPESALAHIRADAKQQHIVIYALNISGAELLVYYTNLNYFSEVSALDRLTSLLMTDAPPPVEKLRMIAVVGGIPQREFDVLRAPAERSFAQDGKLDFANDVSLNPAPMQNPLLAAAERGTYPKFSWDVYPQFRQELFDPTNPLGVQFVGAATGSAELLQGLSLQGEVEANIWNNFNINRLSNSVLPHVRTDFIKYFTEGENGIGLLDTEYRFRLTPEIFGILKAGYLESMFAGAGGEILWRPEGQRWALGGDLYEVSQRDYDRLFGLQPYHALTGHVSLYYASPWYGMNFVMRAGQYLAQDRGISIEMSRRFATGVEVGAFLTKTNVSSAQFGEGSFDKGITIRIPIGWVAPIDTQGELDTILRPVQRDGGQRLAGDAILYDETRRTGEDEIHRVLDAETAQ